jgi:hypothetical protein
MPQTYEDVLASAFEDELTKLAQDKLSALTPLQKALGLMAAGGVAYETARRANSDRRMGRVMRLQNQGF